MNGPLSSQDELMCEYNGVQRLTDLDDMVPDTIYLSNLHVEICTRIATLMGLSGSEHRVYTNLLVKNSKKTKSITALISLVRADKIKPVAIRSTFMSREFLEEYLDLSGIDLDLGLEVPCSFIDRHHLKRVFVKLLLNRVYRFFFHRISSLSAVRSWVEISQRMYSDKYPESVILIYPFYLNLKRHLNYVRQCFKEYNKVTLCGLPYSLLDYLKIALLSKNKDLNLVRFESNAYRRHALELVQLGVKHLYTSDEFEVGAVVLAATLQSKGAQVTNTAHGMSFGCPYASYDTFYVYNEAQRSYYSIKSPQVAYLVAPRSNTDPANCVMGSQGNKAIIFLEANYERLGMKYYACLEKRTVDALRTLGENLGVKVYVKIHPNRKAPAELEDFTVQGVNAIRHLSELADVEPVFVSFYSAAYYDFRHLGPFVFVYDGFVRPEEIYGEAKLACAPLDQIAEELNPLLS